MEGYTVVLFNVVIDNTSVKLWVLVSSTGKVFCRRVRDLGSNPAYAKNQLMSWPNGKNNHHERTP